MPLKPYYGPHAGITIYHGDCREIIPQLGCVDVVITDPVWPNAHPDLAGATDPKELLRSAAEVFNTQRVVIQIGSCSDPRFLSAIPRRFPFLRVSPLESWPPVYAGRLVVSYDFAYVFGSAPQTKGLIPATGKGAPSLPGKPAHPCPRRLRHLLWLVRWFAEGVVLDPFAGAGTTLLAAKNIGLDCVGIEIEERYCEISAKRLEQEVFNFSGVEAEAVNA